jgi:site-specific DNA recombinase
MHAAIYARVSTERQERQQTIDSQLAALRAWASQQGHELADEHVFRDEGLSGSRLDRPGLDALRDAVRDAAIDILAVLSPDRLARKYAYQVLLLEEFRRAGCEVVFLHHPISDDPNDQLLLQIQGAIAEYERAVLSERFRRGKLQKARAGCWLAGRAPYGYRYVPRRETVPGYLVVEETEAELVRLLYGWLVEERMTIRQMVKRLNLGPWFPRSGPHPWSPTTVHHILAHPVYTGTGYVNRYAYVPPKKPRRPCRRGDIATCRQLRPKEEWIPIPAPVIIDQAYWDRAQAQLAVNAKLSFRHNTKYTYLLRCLLTCGTCGLAMFGRTYQARARQPERRYYCCHGKDCILSARERACPSRLVKAPELDAAVWEHVVGLLGDPAQLAAQFTRCVTAGEDDDAAHVADEQLAARRRRLERQEARLLDAYQAEVIDLAELAARRRQLGQQRDALERQRAEQQRRRQRHRQTQEVLSSLAAFTDRIQDRLQAASLADRRAILELVIERIIVHAGTGSLEIRHAIPLRSPSPGRTKPAVLDAQLRSDGVGPTALVARRRGHLLRYLPEAASAIADRDLGCDDQARGFEPDLEADQLLLAFRGRAASAHFLQPPTSSGCSTPRSASGRAGTGRLLARST